MSLILEALKKSEDKRRLGAAPDLATPFSAPRRRSWVWPIAVLLVVAGLVAWALRPAAPPAPPPAGTASASKANAPAVHAVPTARQKTGTPLHSVTGNNDLAQTAPPPTVAKPPVRPAGGQFVPGQPDANTATPAQPPRSGREIFEAMRKQGAERAQAQRQAQASAAKTPPPAKANPAAPARTARVNPPPPPVVPAPVAAAPAQAAPPPVTAPAPVAATPPAKTDAVASTAAPGRAPKSSSTIGLTPAPPAAPSAKPAPTASSAQPYAELPFSVRKSMPELKLSMHVYAADPSQRFVVLNDSRLTEGEKTSDDIFVREIRPDGVVLEFQNQRFFYPRDGL